MSNHEESVRQCYSTWGESYYSDYYDSESAYPPVHRELIRSELRAAKPRNLIDAGCGPASILRDLTDLEIDLYGFDLTPEMLDECRRVMESRGFDPGHFWAGSVSTGSDFFREVSPETYDAAICIGVLPHIPAEEDITVIKNLRESVREGGIVMVEARNELFSLFTLNRYSKKFFEERLFSMGNLREGSSELIQKVDEELDLRFRIDLPPIRGGKETEPGYDEILSRMHNPFELANEFQRAGFGNIRTLFYHYHALPPMFESMNPKRFRELSLKMEEDPTDWRGYFMASAFLTVGIAE